MSLTVFSAFRYLVKIAPAKVARSPDEGSGKLEKRRRLRKSIDQVGKATPGRRGGTQLDGEKMSCSKRRQSSGAGFIENLREGKKRGLKNYILTQGLLGKGEADRVRIPMVERVRFSSAELS